MINKSKMAQSDKRKFRVIRGIVEATSPVLATLMRDTTAPTLAFLAERHGLRRVPGLSQDALIVRILRNLSPQGLKGLESDLIAARYGGLPIQELIDLA